MAEGYWLVGGDGGHLHLRHAPSSTAPPGRCTSSGRSWPSRRPPTAAGLLARRLGRRHLRLRQRRVLRIDPGDRPGSGRDPGAARRLNAPIVGMVPSVDGAGYFMVASDGGVFAFGDARFAGSCPGIGGCSGCGGGRHARRHRRRVLGGDGHRQRLCLRRRPRARTSPGPRSAPVTSAVRTPDGKGYWILFADGFGVRLRNGRQLREPVGRRRREPGHRRVRHRRRRRVLGGHGQRDRPLRSATPRSSGRHVRLVHLNAPVIAASGF